MRWLRSTRVKRVVIEKAHMSFMGSGRASVRPAVPNSDDSMAAVRHYVDAFNNGDEKSMAAACADPMQILDGMRLMSGTGQPPPRTGSPSGCG